MVLLRVARVESFETPDGELGRRIELVEERPARGPSVVPARPMSEDVRLAHELAQSMFQAMQAQLPFFRVSRRIRIPKIVLFLTEAECEELGLEFNVNQVYEVRFSGGAIKFKRVE